MKQPTGRPSALFSTLRVLCLLCAVSLAGPLLGCSDDDGGTPGAVSDAGGLDDAFVGPSDDAGRVDVEVDERAPRAFQMAMAVPADGLLDDFGTASWQRAARSSDIITLRISSGLPWDEIVAGDPLPAVFEARLADLADRARQLPQALHLVVDPLNADRDGLVANRYGAGTLDPTTLRFDQAAVRAGYDAFCAALAQRFEPRYFTPVVGINLYGQEAPEDFAALVTTYEQARENAKFASPGSLVFPEWDFAALRAAREQGDTTHIGWVTELDESIDFFALGFRIATTGATASELSQNLFDAFDRQEIGAMSTRRLLLSNVAYPAEGVVLDGEVFPSSENSQFNYLAYVLDEADRRDVEFVSWSAVVDPDAWLRDPCPEASCDPVAVEAEHGAQRRHGLQDSEGTDRAAGRLWTQYYTREYVR